MPLHVSLTAFAVSQVTTDVEVAQTFLRCDATGYPPAILVQASTVTYVDRKDPSSLLIHGTADRLVPCAQKLPLRPAPCPP